MVDSTKMLSQQTLVRAGTSNNPLGLYNYEQYSAVVDWNMPLWPSNINGNIDIVKVNDVVTLTIRPFLNPNSGVVGNRPISGFTYRLPKRFWPKMETLDINNIDMFLPIVCYQDGTTYSMGYVAIRNQVADPLSPSNGFMSIYALNTGIPGFTNLSGNIRTTTVSYKTNSILNE
jgi:hypothetical protein